MTWTLLTACGSFLMGLAVMAGAFGSHLLRARLDERAFEIFEIGVRYHLIHGIGILAVGLVASRIETSGVKTAGGLLCLGTVLFSGSLYYLALGGPKGVGMVTPVGGLLLIAGWLWLAGVLFSFSFTS